MSLKDFNADLYVPEKITDRGTLHTQFLTGHERLAVLSAILRQPYIKEAWDYSTLEVEITEKGECGAAGCAVGWWRYFSADKKFPTGVLTHIFWGRLADELGVLMADVTPEQVADAIDEYLSDPAAYTMKVKLGEWNNG